MTKLSNFLSSVKLTVVLLIVLAVLSVVGTVIPQQEPAGLYERMYGEGTASLFRSLGFTNMYASPLFVALLGFLGANLVVCSLDRLPKTWKLVRNRPSLNPREYKQMPYRREQFVKLRNPEWRKSLSNVLGRLGKVQEKEFDGGIVYFANRTPWVRLGVYVVHSSILLLFVGGIIGAVWGFKGHINILEGETVDHIDVRGRHEPKPLDFQIRCDDFNVEFYDTGAPKEFRSDLTFLEGGKEALSSPLRVNHPVTFGGITFYQSSYGSTLGGEVVFELVDNQTGETYTVKGPASDDFSLPGDQGGFRIIDFQNNLVSRGMSFGPGVFVHLMGTGERTPPFWVLQKFPQLDQRRGGKYTFALKSFQEVYYTGLQANRDPGVALVYLGFILMLIGFPVTFFMSHRMIWLQVGSTGKNLKVILAGTAHRNRLAFSKSMDGLWEEISTALNEEERQP